MNEILYLIKKYNLKPFDGIVLNKINKKFGFDHYAIFAGYDKNSMPVFVANNYNGINIIPLEKVREYLKSMHIKEIKRFKGDRQSAFRRLKSVMENRSRYSYHLLFNNCEHFFNYVWYGIPKSKQVENAALMGVGTGALLALSGKSPVLGSIIGGFSFLVLLNQSLR